MIPSSFDVVTMFYNKDLFAKAGAPLPTADWTWADFTAACKTVLAKTGAYCFANGGNLPGFDWWAYFVPFVAGYGGKVISDDGKTMQLTTPEALAGEQAFFQHAAHHLRQRRAIERASTRPRRDRGSGGAEANVESERPAPVSGTSLPGDTRSTSGRATGGLPSSPARPRPGSRSSCATSPGRSGPRRRSEAP